MRITVLGTGDAFTSRSFGSSVLIEADDTRFLLDCPDLIHRALKEGTNAARTAADIDDIVLTHIHGDHCNGLESFGFWRFFAARKGITEARPRLWTHPQCASRLWERLAPAMDAPVDGKPMTLSDFFDVRPNAIGNPFEIGPIRIETRRTHHPVPTMALRVIHAGKSLGWSCDTNFDRELINWLADCDLIVHEVNHPPVHTPIEKLNELPDALRAKMRLSHLADDFDQSATDMRALSDGEVIDL